MAVARGESVLAWAEAGDGTVVAGTRDALYLGGLRLPWERVVPGVHVRIGEVLTEIGSYALPCKTNARWFLDGHFDVMHHRHGPVSRVYGTVLEPGTIRVGDPVVLEPEAR